MKNLFYSLFLTLISFNIFAETTESTQVTAPAETETKNIINFKILGEKSFVEANKEVHNFEVIYFFSYSCPHCYTFDSYFKMWKEKNTNPKVKTTLIPVQFGKNWDISAKAFEIGKRLNKEKEVNEKLFPYMHEAQNDFFTKDDLVNFFTKELNIDKEEVLKHYNSFSLNIALKDYNRVVDDFNIMGTPTIVVVTKNKAAFLTSPEYADSPVNMVVTIDYLISKLQEKYYQ